VGDPIDLMPCYPYIRAAARRQGPVGWVGWFFGVSLTALAIYDRRLILLVLGLGLLIPMAVWTVFQVRQQRRWSALGAEDGPDSEPLRRDL
jgi:hypothetical protein